MFFVLSKIAAPFLSPLLWFFFFMGTSCLFRKKKPRWKRWFASTGWVILILFSNPILLELGWRTWEVPVSTPSGLKRSYDCAMVLGGHSDPVASSSEKLVLGSDPNRLTDALRLYKTGRVKRLVLTGGTGALFGEKVSEAPLAAAFLKDLGIPAADVLVEPASRNTHENAVNTAALLETEIRGGDPVLLVTSAFHMRRAVAAFEKTGLNVVPYATDSRVHGDWTPDLRAFIPNPWALAEWQFLIREWVGFLAYKIR